MNPKSTKTNVVRFLEQRGIDFETLEYDVSEKIPSGVEVARQVGLCEDEVFKTLVTRGASGGYYVFVIPVAASLNLKKAAGASGEKSIEMIRQAELLPLTGYIHGGCSPIGMKKKFPTFFAEEIILIERIAVSAGRPGLQIRLSPGELVRAVDGVITELI